MLLETLVERSVYHLLRKEVVKRGYLPDIFQYDIQSADATIARSENERYKRDIVAIKNNKGFAIEVFNYSTNQAYGDKNVPRIVVQTDAFMPGAIGLDPTRNYVKQPDGTFSLTKSTELVSDFYFSIYLVANSTKIIRELHDIMVTVMPRRGYINRYDDNELRPHSNLLIQYLSTSDISYLAEGIIEKVYKYLTPDVHEVDDRILDITVQEIKEIKVNTEEGDNNIITVQ